MSFKPLTHGVLISNRLSHEDQHKSALDDGELGGAALSPRKAAPKESKITLFDERVQSSKGHGEEENVTEEDQGDSISLQDYVNSYGFTAKNRSSLTQLIEAHTSKPHALSEEDQNKSGEMIYCLYWIDLGYTL